MASDVMRWKMSPHDIQAVVTDEDDYELVANALGATTAEQIIREHNACCNMPNPTVGIEALIEAARTLLRPEVLASLEFRERARNALRLAGVQVK